MFNQSAKMSPLLTSGTSQNDLARLISSPNCVLARLMARIRFFSPDSAITFSTASSLNTMSQSSPTIFCFITSTHRRRMSICSAAARRVLNGTRRVSVMLMFWATWYSYRRGSGLPSGLTGLIAPGSNGKPGVNGTLAMFGSRGSPTVFPYDRC